MVAFVAGMDDSAKRDSRTGMDAIDAGLSYQYVQNGFSLAATIT